MNVDVAREIVSRADKAELQRMADGKPGWIAGLPRAMATLLLHGREMEVFDSAEKAIEYFILDVQKECAARGLVPDERVEESKRLLRALAGDPAGKAG